MIVLRRESEDAECTAIVSLCLRTVRIAEQSSNGELAALDPQLGRLVDGLKRHQAAVRTTDKAVRVFGVLDGACTGLQFAVEELVKGFCGG